MAKLSVKEIRERAKQIIATCQSGIRYKELVRQIKSEHPETPENTIVGSVWDIDRKFPELIRKPSRGLFVPVTGSESFPSAGVSTFKEQDFYKPFAEWLRNELDEVTVAVALGGAGMKSKWGTPDVVGVYKPLPSHRIKFGLEIVSAEIKLEPTEAVTAFGQAAAYRLFSAKSYVVMSSAIGAEDYARLESLCILFGVGLVLFDPNDAQSPNFAIRVRAQRFWPDMFYVNEFADRLYQTNPDVFNELFR